MKKLGYEPKFNSSKSESYYVGKSLLGFSSKMAKFILYLIKKIGL